MNAEERARLRAEGRRAAAELPDISPECARRIAELLREPINQYVADQRRAQRQDGARMSRDQWPPDPGNDSGPAPPRGKPGHAERVVTTPPNTRQNNPSRRQYCPETRRWPL